MKFTYPDLSLQESFDDLYNTFITEDNKRIRIFIFLFFRERERERIPVFLFLDQTFYSESVILGCINTFVCPSCLKWVIHFFQRAIVI